MTNKKEALSSIIISIIFAAAIILSSYLIKGTPYENHSQTIMFFLTMLWWIPFSLNSLRGKRTTCK